MYNIYRTNMCEKIINIIYLQLIAVQLVSSSNFNCEFDVEIVKIEDNKLISTDLTQWWNVPHVSYITQLCMRCAVLLYYLPTPEFSFSTKYGENDPDGFCSKKMIDPFKTFSFLGEEKSPCCILEQYIEQMNKKKREKPKMNQIGSS